MIFLILSTLGTTLWQYHRNRQNPWNALKDICLGETKTDSVFVHSENEREREGQRDREGERSRVPLLCYLLFLDSAIASYLLQDGSRYRVRIRDIAPREM